MDSEISGSNLVSQSIEKEGGGSTRLFNAPSFDEDYGTASESSDDMLSPVGEDTDLTLIPDEKTDGLNGDVEKSVEAEEKDENLVVKPVEAEEESPVYEAVEKVEENGKGIVEIEEEEGFVEECPTSAEVVSESNVFDEGQFESETVDKSNVSKNDSSIVEVGSVMKAEEWNRSTTDVDASEKERDLKPVDVEKIDSAVKSVEVAKEEDANVGESLDPILKGEKENQSDEGVSEAIGLEEEKRSAANVEVVEKEIDLKAIEVESDANDAKNGYLAVESTEAGKEENDKIEVGEEENDKVGESDAIESTEVGKVESNKVGESVIPIVEQENRNESDIIEVVSVIEAEEENESTTQVDVVEKERDLKPIEVELSANGVEEVGSVVELNEVVKEEEKNVVDEEKTRDEELSKVVDDVKNVDNVKIDDITLSEVIDEREHDIVEEENNLVAEAFDAIQNNTEALELDAVEKDIVVVEAKKIKAIEPETEDKAVLDAEDSSNDNAESPSIIIEDSKSNQESPSQSIEDSTEDAVAETSPPVDDDDDENYAQNNEQEQQPSVAILDSSELAKQLIREMGENSSRTSFESSRSYQNQIDGQIVTDSDEEPDSDGEDSGKEMFDSAALAALLKAATGGGDSSEGNITITSQDGTRVFTMDRPAGLGSSAPSLRPGPARSARPSIFSPSELALAPEPDVEMDEEERKLQENVEKIRVKFLRLITRLGCSVEDSVAAQVLYRLSLAEGIRRGRQTGRAFSVESAKKKALQLEEQGDEEADLNFSCNILVLGKSGVGKSATINSIFNEPKTHTDPFKAATISVREISGTVDGVKIRVLDTPGLKPSVTDQSSNRKILSSITKHIKKCPPDIVLYVDRLDTQTRDFNDLPLLKSITSALGPSIWFSAIVALTHSSSAPPEGPNGTTLSYDVFVAQRSHVVQHSIRQAAGDMRLMNPVALVENHLSCRRNRDGERVLPNGVSWRPQMMLLCYSSKILAEANSLLKLQEPSPGKLFGFRLRSPPLPYLLSTLLQTRAHPKDNGDNGENSDIDLDDFSDAEDGEEDEYDSLPPFKPLKRSQIARLTKEQKRSYFDEYDYRVFLLQKKQFRDEIRRLKEMKRRGKDNTDDGNEADFDSPASVPVAMPDMVLPPSFDPEAPTYRYRFLEPGSGLLTRPVLDPHGWDHDCGYDGVSVEENVSVLGRFPSMVAVQITKDKKDFSIHLDSSVAAKHGDNGSSLAGFDVQTVGKQLAYIVRGETKFKSLKRNKTTVGGSVTFLGENVATGVKLEDQVNFKRVGLVVSTGAIRSQGDVAYGANFEGRLKEKENVMGTLGTLGLSLMKWRGDLAVGANMQGGVSVGRGEKVSVRVSLNNKRSGQISVRISSSEQLKLALVAVVPVFVNAYKQLWAAGEEY